MLKCISKTSCISNWIQNAPFYGWKQISTQVFPLQFKASPALWAEPLKKKKKIDPAIIKAREERKRKKLRKEIKRLEMKKQPLKPIADMEIPQCLLEEPEARKREIEVPDDVKEKRILLMKTWSKTKGKERFLDILTLHRLMRSQQRALNELRLESEELYQAAVKIDENLVPFKFIGPTLTPPKEDYPLPDGAYIDESKKWI